MQSFCKKNGESKVFPFSNEAQRETGGGIMYPNAKTNKRTQILKGWSHPVITDAC